MSNFYCRLPPVANICRARWLAGWSWSTWLFFGARWLVRAGCPNSLRAWTSFSPADSPWHDDLYCHESKIGKSLAPEQFRWQIYNSYSKAGKLVGTNRKGGKYLNIPAAWVAVTARRGRAAGEGAVIPFLPGCSYCAVNCDGGVCTSFSFCVLA